MLSLRAAFFIFLLWSIAPPSRLALAYDDPPLDATRNRNADPQEYLPILQLAGTQQYDVVIDRCHQLIRRHIMCERAYRKLVQAYRERRQLYRAETYLRGLLREDPENLPAHYVLALVLAERKEHARAVRWFEKCIDMKPLFAGAYSGLADAYKELKRLDEAARHLQGRLATDEQNAAAHYGLGRIWELGYRWERGLAHLDRALALDPYLLEAYMSKISIYLNTARFQEMLTTAMAGLTAALKAEDLEAKGRFLGRVGLACWYLGDEARAIEYYQQALKTARAIMDRSDEGVQLNNLAIAYRSLSEHRKALEAYEEALKIARALGSPRAEAIRLDNIGNVYRDLRDYSRALQCYRQALAIAGRLADKRIEGYLLNNFGKTYTKLEDYTQAATYHQRALRVGEEIRVPEILWQAHVGLAMAYEKQADPRRALQHYMLAINTLEDLRRGLSREGHRYGFLQNKIETYQRLINLLIALHKKDPDAGYARKAFFYTESIKARALLDGIYEGLILRIVNEMPEAFQSRFSSNRNLLEKSYARLAGVSDDERRVVLEAEVEALEKEKSELLEELKLKHPRLQELTRPKILAAEDVQGRLAKGYALLEYMVGAESTLVWVVDRDSLNYVELPIGSASLRPLMTDISDKLFANYERNKNGQRTPLKSDHVWANIQIPKLHQAYQSLVQPLEKYLRPGNKLLIVADDVLHYLPFEMLVTRMAGEKWEHLIEKYPISYMASASVLSPELYRGQEDTAPAKKGSLLALGNPYFGDRGSNEPIQGPAAGLSDLEPAAMANNGRLRPLPYSEDEVRSISRLFDRPEMLIGRAATEGRFKALSPFYRILHISTHSILDDRQWIYSRLVFAQTPQSGEDGNLHAYEIFNLRLNAELAVLSACQTGLGRFSHGEGLLGMSRAFLYAGVPSLLASLWPVDDESTAILMRNFYQNLARGLDKQRALQRAKLELIARGDRMKNPFYWAPFVLLGDWKEIKIPIQPSRDYRLIWILGLILLALAGYLFLRKPATNS